MRTRILGYGLLILALSLLAGCVPITIGGSITGLTGTGLVLQNNGADDLAITEDGSFAFATPLPNTGGLYEVTIKTQPNGQICTVTNGSGTATAKVTNVNVQCVANAIPDLELLAGTLGGPGNIDGAGAAARFNAPGGLAIDNAGNTYVADSRNHTVRKITPTGMVTTLAGSAGIAGSADGTGADARFYYPHGITVDRVGYVYVADGLNYTIRKISPAGVVTTLAGAAGISGSEDGTGADARFASSSHLALDSEGNVYVNDQGNHTIRKISPAGAVTTLAGTAGVSGSADGIGADARFNSPSGIGVDSAGNVYVSDGDNFTIRKITPAGVVTTLAGTAGVAGSADGTGPDATFYYPSGLALDNAGNLYVAEYHNFTIRKVSPTGVVTTLAGVALSMGSADGAGAAARFYLPSGIALDNAGNAYVSDSGNHTIRKISPEGTVTTMAGKAGSDGSANGTGATAKFFYARSIALDNAANVYVAANFAIRKISPDGVVTTLAGGDAPGSADGTGANARFNLALSVAVDSAGNVYVADAQNHTIRKITPTGVVSTLAGTANSPGNADGTGANARFQFPNGVTVDGTGNVYVADTANGLIRKITPAGVVSTLTSPGGFGGTGTAAKFFRPSAIALDSLGNIYVTELRDNRIQKISPAGIITTLAGGISGNADGAGTNARFKDLRAIAVDSADNIYVADTGNSTIRKITPAGVVSTVLGSAGKAGVVLGDLPASLGLETFGVAVSADKLFVISENSVLWAPKP